MSRIKYLCLSDMHLGEEDSLLTNIKEAGTEVDPFSPSPVMVGLAECIREIVTPEDRTTLVLNGDILEMALADINEALMVFERFIELTMPAGEPTLFEKVVFIPGNHDHHLWEQARETQYVEYVLKGSKPGDPLPKPWHATNLFAMGHPNPVYSYVLDNLLKRFPHLQEKKVQVAYPNLALESADRKRYAFFHHGHFIEPLYTLITQFVQMMFPGRELPHEVWDLEEQNFAWIDFFWSALGRSGAAGQDIEKIYEKMHNREAFGKLLDNLAKGLSEKFDIPLVPTDWLEEKLLRRLLGAIADKVYGTERKKKTDDPLSSEGWAGLKDYMERYMWGQYVTERGNTIYDASFIFGHTHKPFSMVKDYAGFPQNMAVYNTGGWVVESEDEDGQKGAAMVLLDEDLNSVSLRMYNEGAGPDGRVRLEEALLEGEPHNRLFTTLAEKFDFGSGPWKDFSRTAAVEAAKRAKALKKRISSE